MKSTAWAPPRATDNDRQTLAFYALMCTAGSALLWCEVKPLTMWLTFATFHRLR